MRAEIGQDNDTEVQMAPLIDCVFLLLIFFLVATTLKKIDNELKVELPEAVASVQVQTPEDLLIVSLDETGRIHLAATPVDLSMLHERLQQAAAQDPTQRVRIDADRAAPLQAFVHIYDLLKLEGLDNVRLKIAEDKNRN